MAPDATGDPHVPLGRDRERCSAGVWGRLRPFVDLCAARSPGDDPDRAECEPGFPSGRLEFGAVAGNLEVEVSRMAVIALRGEIDLAGLDDLQSAVEPHLAPGQTVVLDLSGVTFADSTLLKVLQRAHGKVTNVGGALLIRNPSDQVRQLLSLGDLDHLAQTEVDRQNNPPSGDAALRSGSTTENPPC